MSDIEHDACVSPTISRYTTIYDASGEQPLADESSYSLYETVLSQYPLILEQVKFAFSQSRLQTAKLTQSIETTAILEQYGNTEEASLVCVASLLSTHFSCPALAVFLHSDTEFWYHLNQEGRMIDEYTTYAEENWQPGSGILSLTGQQIKGGKAYHLCEAFNRKGMHEEVELILRKPASSGTCTHTFNDFNYEAVLQLPGFPDGIIRHYALAVVLGMQPHWVMYMSYNRLRQGLVDHFDDDPQAPSKEEALRVLKPTFRPLICHTQRLAPKAFSSKYFKS